MKKWPFVIALIMLVGAWSTIESLSYGESIKSKRPFRDFPLTLESQWKGKELGLEEKVLDVLKLTDYLMRVYWPIPDTASQGGEPLSADTHSSEQVEGRAQDGPLWLYIGYYESQRTGSTYHSPKNCLPGAGWQFVESEYVTVPMGQGQKKMINRVLIKKGLEQQVILYWYQDRGRVIASEYWAKGYMIWDAMTKNRTDGSLVRISIPVVSSAEDAYRQGVDFIQDLWPVLLEFMPDQSFAIA